MGFWGQSLTVQVAANQRRNEMMQQLLIDETRENASHLMEQNRLARESISSQENYQFKIWLQTPDGESFEEWSSRATLYIATLSSIENRWPESWKQAFESKYGKYQHEKDGMKDSGFACLSIGVISCILALIYLWIRSKISFIDGVMRYGLGIWGLRIGIPLCAISVPLILFGWRIDKAHRRMVKSQILEFGFNPFVAKAEFPDWNSSWYYSPAVVSSVLETAYRKLPRELPGLDWDLRPVDPLPDWPQEVSDFLVEIDSALLKVRNVNRGSPASYVPIEPEIVLGTVPALEAGNEIAALLESDNGVNMIESHIEVVHPAEALAIFRQRISNELAEVIGIEAPADLPDILL
jgi:hypothetical protein